MLFPILNSNQTQFFKHPFFSISSIITSQMSNSHSNVSWVSPKTLFLTLILLSPTLVFGGCTCEPEEEDRNTTRALKYKLAALASILAASASGVCLPVLSKSIPALSPDRSFFFIIKAFAAGVILSTGFIHVLPDAFEYLTSPCIPEHPWGDFPFTGFIAMCSAIGTLMVDCYATSYYRRRSSVVTSEEEKKGGGGADVEGVVPVHTHATHGHAHGSVSLDFDHKETELLRHRVISQVLELGIIVHSVIIGIALGALESPKTIKPLIAALTFHQFFEGIGLGGCITQAKFNARAVTIMALFFSLTLNARAVTIMALFFSLTTPAGIVIGIGISKSYNESSATALIVEGVLSSASAGILIYMALVNLLAADFMSPKLQNNGKLQLGASASLLFGAGCVSLLAKWV